MYTFETQINVSKARHTELLVNSRYAPSKIDSRIGQAALSRLARIFRWIIGDQGRETNASQFLELRPCC
jgi:hypothetical protein